MNSLFCGPHSSFTYTYVADHSHWMHLHAGLLCHCQDCIGDKSRGSEAKSQQRTSDGWDSFMLRRLLKIVSKQAQSNSNSNNPIVESQIVRQVQVVLFVCYWWLILSSKAVLVQQRECSERPPISVCSETAHNCWAWITVHPQNWQKFSHVNVGNLPKLKIVQLLNNCLNSVLQLSAPPWTVEKRGS